MGKERETERRGLVNMRTVKLRIEDFETGYQDKPSYVYVDTELDDMAITEILDREYARWTDRNDGSTQLSRVIALIGKRANAPILSTFVFKTYKLDR